MRTTILPLVLLLLIALTDVAGAHGVDIDATLVMPLGLPPSGGFPTLILIHGLGSDKETMYPLAITMAMYGYASLCYTVRGHGNSGGFSTLDGPREIQDLREVISYTRSRPLLNRNALAIVGGSQGGIHGWAAAVYNMPGVRTVVPMLATPDFAEALIPNGCIAFGLPREMSIGSVRYDPIRDVVKGLIIRDRIDSLRQFVAERDLFYRIDSVRIPVYQALGWSDFLFPVNGGIHARSRMASRNVPVWSFFGTNGHGVPFDPTEFPQFIESAVQWTDHWLKGFGLAGAEIPSVLYTDDRPGAPFHDTPVWPPQPCSRYRLYITGSGLTSSLPSTDVQAEFSVSYDSAYTAEMAWDDEYSGPDFRSAFQRTALRFLSEPLPAAMEITDIPSVQLHVTSPDSMLQVHVRFFDVHNDPGGEVWDFMSRANAAIRANAPGSARVVAVDGRALSHIVTAGHRIGIEITSLDMLDSNSAAIIPFFRSTGCTLISTAVTPSFIEVPVVGWMPTGTGKGDPDMPSAALLEQNYPNPFNPTTSIKFKVPGSTVVTLRVFDVLGREVATLLNEEKSAGVYTVQWDAGGISGGVYFCRLQTATVTQTRRMVLVR
jgi:predicted acyl esterase